MSAEQIKRLVAEFGKARFAVGDSGQGHGAAEAAYARVCAAIDAALPGVQPCTLCNALIVERNATHYDQQDLDAAAVRARILADRLAERASPQAVPAERSIYDETWADRDWRAPQAVDAPVALRDAPNRGSIQAMRQAQSALKRWLMKEGGAELIYEASSYLMAALSQERPNEGGTDV